MRRVVGLVVLLVAVLVVLALAPAGQRRWQEHRQIGLGERLLQGGAAGAVADRIVDGGSATVLRGRLAGHPGDLPSAATRCVNCHATGATAGQLLTAAFGPSLDSDALARAISRRGGPPSRYDAVSLCRLLREGIDPAWVMVDASMPRYEVSDAQCQALWTRIVRLPVS